MFDLSTQQLRERLRGFEEEIDELEHVLRFQQSEETQRELDRLAPEARSLFALRQDAAAYDRLVHVIAGLRLDPERLLPFLKVRLLGEDEAALEHLLRAENSALPRRRIELARLRKTEKNRAWKSAFRAEGLDGQALMELLGMKPGREFGNRLREVQAWARGEGDAPHVEASILKQISSRVEAARGRIKKL
ncbi:TPA: hypothetical protein DDZ10_02605 [Candidatus Uhrbacteria bacterium]|nr:MAG: hypothetical protein A3D69_01745 [Candidatus Uhrbacteria bacterium RIFCSPHIGHO2_02_FULL_54_11]HBL39540.1 hypothetical protein [Candidatus Uhrbacteria bacterium]